MSRFEARDGFTLVEVLFALMILAVGVLAMGATTGYIVTQVAVAQMRTERMSAVREVAERLQAEGFDDVGTACSSSFSVGNYTVSCTVSSVTSRLKDVELISTGPGYVQGSGIERTVEDTVNISISDT